MPLDRTVQDAVSALASEQHISRSQARRMLQERIDLARRIKVRDKSRSSVEISNDGVHSRIANKTIRPENPMRLFVEVGEAPKPTPKPITVKQRQALLANKRNRSNTAQTEPVESEVPTPPLSDFIDREQRDREVRQEAAFHRLPTPGTLTGIIVGTLRDPEKDFTKAFTALRGMGTRFDHMNDAQLKKRMHTVSQRYGIPIRHHHSDSQPS
jgi:hypothetical protein